MFLNAAYNGTVHMQFRSGCAVFLRTVLFHPFCCSKVTISLVDHAAGNLEGLPSPLLAGQEAANAWKFIEKSKCSWKVRVCKRFGALVTSLGLVKHGLVLLLVSWNFLGFSILCRI